MIIITGNGPLYCCPQIVNPQRTMKTKSREQT